MANLMFKVIDERYNKSKPLMMPTNLDEQGRAEYVGYPIYSQAIVDRIYHNSIKAIIKRLSYKEYYGKFLQDQYNQ